MKRLRSKLALLLAALTILAVGVPSLISMPQYDTVYTYYSDATYTTEVGHIWMMCHLTWWDGTTSDYLDISVGDSCSNGGPVPGTYECWGWTPQDHTYCGDSVDNDGDGLIDSYDPGCRRGCNG